MKHKIIYVLIAFVLLILPSGTVKARTLDESEANVCKYALTDKHQNKTVTFYAMPFINFGADVQGAMEWALFGSYPVTTFAVRPTGYTYKGLTVGGGGMSFDANFTFQEKIKINGKNQITSCPSICYAINDNKHVEFFPNSDCPGALRQLTEKANGEIENRHGLKPPPLTPGTPISSTDNPCDALFTPEAIELIRKIVGYIQILAPLLLIIMCSVDMVMAVMAKDERQIKASFVKSAKRIIAAICIFIIPIFVSILLGMQGIRGSMIDVGITADPLCLNSKGTKALRVLVKLDPYKYTKGNVKINISTVIGDYDYATVNSSRVQTKTGSNDKKEIEYVVSENGSYEFEFYDSGGKLLLKKKVVIKNISREPPKGTCSVKNNIITTNVSAVSGITSYSYSINGGAYSAPTNKRTYSNGSTITTASVKAKDNVNNELTITCTVTPPSSGGGTVSGGLEVFFVSVSWGDSIIIRSKSKVVVIDGGLATYGNTNTVPFMKDLGITKIDAYIASHYHLDHVGATPAIYKNFSVEKSYGPSPEGVNSSGLYNKPSVMNKNYTQMKYGDKINFGEFTLEVVGPITLTKSCTTKAICQNTDSLNILLRHGDITFFFTGDYMQSEKMLVQYSKDTFKADMLKQPHHGQHDYISWEMLSAVNPKYIVMTANSGSCRSEKMRNWHAQIGSSLHWTGRGKSGNMAFISDGKSLKLNEKVNASSYSR